MHAIDLQLASQLFDDRRSRLSRDRNQTSRDTRRIVRQWQRSLVRH
jgi:hypothetical protein